MANDWIKLQIHPEHHKVLVLSDLTGASPETVFASSVRWFRHLDRHYTGQTLTVSETSFHRITLWTGRTSLAASMCSEPVGWLIQSTPGMFQPTDPEAHFSSSAKKRALTAKRVSANRERNAGVTQPALQDRYLEKEKEKEKEQSSSSYASASEKAVAEELGDRIRLLMSIGLGTGDAARWAKHANATPERIRFLVAKAASGVWTGQAVANVCAGIRDAWDVPAAEVDTVKAKAARILAGVGKVRKPKEHQ